MRVRILWRGHVLAVRETRVCVRAGSCDKEPRSSVSSLLLRFEATIHPRARGRQGRPRRSWRRHRRADRLRGVGKHRWGRGPPQLDSQQTYNAISTSNVTPLLELGVQQAGWSGSTPPARSSAESPGHLVEWLPPLRRRSLRRSRRCVEWWFVAGRSMASTSNRSKTCPTAASISSSPSASESRQWPSAWPPVPGPLPTCALCAWCHPGSR
jgi:hypothetical protein